MARGDSGEDAPAGDDAQATPKKAELLERLTKSLARLNKAELTELVRKLDEGELDLRKLAQPPAGSDGGPLRFGFQQRLRERK